MRNKLKKLLCIILAAVSIMLVLPLSVSAACRMCGYGGTLWAEAYHPHQQFYYCLNGCGSKQYTGGYITKSNCAMCNPSIQNCSHTSTWTNPQHPHDTVCTGCCRLMNYGSNPYGCSQCCVTTAHKTHGRKRYIRLAVITTSITRVQAAEPLFTKA